MDFNIIVPHRGSDIGLWTTITTCENQLKSSKFKYNYSIVVNGEEKESDFIKELVRVLKQNDKLGFYHTQKESLAPPEARQLAVDNTSGRLLVFFDNHCIPDESYFSLVSDTFERNDVDILHSSHIYFPCQNQSYQYNLTLGYNFWGTESGLPYHPFKPYKVAASGHGGFIARRSSWNDIGGYGPKGLLVGYAGEELIVDLKAWRLGKKVWMHPKLIHYHYAGVRDYSRHYTDEYYTNLLVCALVIGGESWFNKVFNSFISPGKHIRTMNNIKPMYDLYQAAYERGITYSKELDSKAKFSLDQLLNSEFSNQEVMY